MQADTGSAEHVPVLYQSVLEWLHPQPGRPYVDGTIGGGGHAEGILKLGARLLGLDRDPDALRAAARRLAPFADRLILRQASYRRAGEILKEVGWGRVAGIVVDLGLSSLQLGDPQRGFAFREDGPLDMRFDRSGGETAADLVNTLPEDEIAEILFRCGEEPRARRIARAVVRARPLSGTRQLADAVAAAVGAGSRPWRVHPATKTFQALRIAVNRELEELAEGLPLLMNSLETGGRLMVISFHSLEDRLVKQTFRRACGETAKGERILPGPRPPSAFREITRKPVRPDAAELAANPRSRSAKLRGIERLSLPEAQAAGESRGGRN
ncbi:MAG: 16S rRNA (cytosine(1402)-N(4))-methyltransferase RsmH [Anaerolineales bacterium]|nr:16S rRNA (cytosine(1402)-N(4))-methyltransferase RsmH [Anaerolineales bacterium]